MHLHPGHEPGALCEVVEPCGRVRVDLRHGVPLACVTVVERACDRWIGTVEPCGPRRLVKRNDLLFDLLRGCDLTRIAAIGWSAWHRHEARVPFGDFAAAFWSDNPMDGDVDRKRFWIGFSRPILAKTVRPDCFTMTALRPEGEGGWWVPQRIPIVGVETISSPEDPPGYARRAHFIVDGGWLDDAIKGRYSIFIGQEIRVEIEVRGDFIVDCNGQTIDANAVGLLNNRFGNGSPGGTFVSTFVVGMRDRVASPAVARSTTGGVS
jgi:hypothetical protein